MATVGAAVAPPDEAWREGQREGGLEPLVARLQEESVCVCVFLKNFLGETSVIVDCFLPVLNSTS